MTGRSKLRSLQYCVWFCRLLWKVFRRRCDVVVTLWSL